MIERKGISRNRMKLKNVHPRYEIALSINYRLHNLYKHSQFKHLYGPRGARRKPLTQLQTIDKREFSANKGASQSLTTTNFPSTYINQSSQAIRPTSAFNLGQVSLVRLKTNCPSTVKFLSVTAAISCFLYVQNPIRDGSA